MSPVESGKFRKRTYRNTSLCNDAPTKKFVSRLSGGRPGFGSRQRRVYFCRPPLLGPGWGSQLSVCPTATADSGRANRSGHDIRNAVSKLRMLAYK